MAEENWADIGSTEDLSRAPLQHVTAGSRELAVSFKDGRFGVVSNGVHPPVARVKCRCFAVA